MLVTPRAEGFFGKTKSDNDLDRMRLLTAGARLRSLASFLFCEACKRVYLSMHIASCPVRFRVALYLSSCEVIEEDRRYMHFCVLLKTGGPIAPALRAAILVTEREPYASLLRVSSTHRR
jgi:hypothetical protein